MVLQEGFDSDPNRGTLVETYEGLFADQDRSTLSKLIGDSGRGNVIKMVIADPMTLPENARAFFGNFASLQSIEGLDKLDTSRVVNAEFVFTFCGNLQALDLTSWNVSRVTSMHGMFQGCASLSTLDLSTWDTSNVEKMSVMFNECDSLRSINLSG